MADKIKVSQLRAQFPMYADVDTTKLLIGLRRKYYPDIPMAKFTSRIEFDDINPTDGTSATERTLAGIGMGMHDLYLGAKQRLGLASQEEVDERRRIEAPLRATTAGTVGNVVGKVAVGIPAAFIPGANTLAGAAAIGGAQGLLEPTATGESIGANVALGAGGGAAVNVIGRGMAAAVNGGRGLVEPFTQGGQQRIVGRTLRRFATDPDNIQRATGRATVTGARPTLAEETSDLGLARLERAVSADPQVDALFVQRAAENNAARVGRLRDMAGQGGGRDFAVAERAGTSGPMYQEAFGVDIAERLTPELEREMRVLMRSPDIRSAMASARTNATNAGRNVGSSNASGSVEGLHNVKTALDDMIAEARGGGGSAARETRARGLQDLQRRLVSFIESVSPEYHSARNVHAQMSRPINQMDVADELLRRGTAATSDLGGTPRLMPDNYLRQLRDEAQLIQRSTGRRAGNALQDLLDPDQLAQVRGIAGELDRGAALSRAANGPGSQTARSLASQNLVRQILGPTGLPESWAENALVRTAMRPAQFIAAAAEPDIQAALARALLDPAQARAALDAVPIETQNALLRLLAPYGRQAAQQSLPAATVSR